MILRASDLLSINKRRLVHFVFWHFAYMNLKCMQPLSLLFTDIQTPQIHHMVIVTSHVQFFVGLHIDFDEEALGIMAYLQSSYYFFSLLFASPCTLLKSFMYIEQLCFSWRFFHCVPCFGFTYFHLMMMELALKRILLVKKTQILGKVLFLSSLY